MTAPNKRWALLAGADQTTELSLMWSVFEGLGPDHRPQDRAFLCQPRLGAEDVFDQLEERKAAPADQSLSIFLVGKLELRRRKLILFLGPHDRSGLRLDELIVELEEISAAQCILLLQVEADEEALAAANALSWPKLALRCFGSRLPEALRAALHAASGARRAGDIASKLPGGHSDRSQAILAVLEAQTPSSAIDPNGERHFKEYLQAITRLANRLPFGDIRDKDALPELDQVYVEPHTIDPGAKEDERRLRPKDKLTLHGALAQHRCIFFIGDPGSGKTTFFNRLLVEMSQHLLEGRVLPDGLPPRPFPLLVTLRDYAADLGKKRPTKENLLKYAFSNLPQQNSAQTLAPKYAEAALKAGRLVLLLDGLDEVPDPDRRARVAQVITDLGHTCDKLILLVTCRPAATRDGARLGEPFVVRNIEPFDNEERLECTTKWLSQRMDEGSSEPEVEAKRLLSDLRYHPKVDAQARNPLVLTMVCVLFRTQGRLPNDRAELYDKLIDLLLKDRGRPWDGPAQEVSHEHRWAALERIATKWREASDDGDKEGALLMESQCVEAANEVLKDDATAQDLVRFFELRTSLLDCHSSQRGRRQLKFGHRTLAEYLVAGSLAAQCLEGAPPEELTSHAHDGDWREIARLYVNIIVRDRNRPHKPAYDFIETLADKASHADNLPQRAAYARLAAECFSECKKEDAPDDVIQLIRDLQPMFRNPESANAMPAIERMDFWEAVGDQAVDLGDQNRCVQMPAGNYWRGAVPGDEQARDNEKPGAWIHQDEFWVQRWPVTVAEYQAFMNDGAASAHEPDEWQGQLHHLTRPVVGVSWFDARGYAQWMEQQSAGQLPEGWSVHLPSEAQWEAAGRGCPRNESAVLHTYPWPGEFDANLANSWQMSVRTSLSPVGAFPGGHTRAKAWDMSGNVYEWCLDAYSDDAYAENKPIAFDASKASDPDTPRVLRGGSFGSVPGHLRLSDRGRSVAGGRYDRIGFRVVSSSLPRTLGI